MVNRDNLFWHAFETHRALFGNSCPFYDDPKTDETQTKQFHGMIRLISDAIDGKPSATKRPVGTGDGSPVRNANGKYTREDIGSRIRVSKGVRPTSYGNETSPFVSIKINGKVIFVRRKGN